MRKDLTDITAVIDRSGSMESCRLEAQNGINKFIDEQKALPGEALFSLVQFDTEYEFVHKGRNIKEVGQYSLLPRGFTALLDAVGKAINETGERLAKMPEAERPGLVAFVIVTDGQENSSKEFNKAQIKEMIERQRGKYSWKFTFIGANQDAFAEAAGLGIARGAALNYVGSASPAAYGAASANLGAMRTTSASGGTVADFDYSDDQRSASATPTSTPSGS